MDDNKYQHEPVDRAIYQRKPDKTHHCKECGCKEDPIRDEQRGELSCVSCGLVSVEKLYDSLNPKTHANTPENNSGRDTLDYSRKAFENRDHAGIPLRSETKSKFRKLNNYQKVIDRTKYAEDNNRVVEKTLQELKRINPTLTKVKEDVFRKSLNKFLSVPEGTKLYKSGSKFNAIACALVLDSECDLVSFYDKLKIHVKSGKISMKDRTSIIKRSKEIRKLLVKHTSLAGKEQILAPVYPHLGEISVRVSTKHEDFISHWWARKVPIVRTYANPPSHTEIQKLYEKVLDNPDILKLKGGEMIEAILDACLLISVVTSGSSSNFSDITDKLSLRPTSRKYHRPLKKYLSQRF